jgi:hypothetical protein
MACYVGAVAGRSCEGQGRLVEECGGHVAAVVELEQELKQVCKAAAVEKKRLEDKLAEEKHKTQEANAQFNTSSIGKVEMLHH